MTNAAIAELARRLQDEIELLRDFPSAREKKEQELSTLAALTQKQDG